MKDLLAKSLSETVLEHLDVRSVSSDWTNWESCGIKAIPIGRDRSSWWRWWPRQVHSSRRYELPEGSLQKILTCKARIPIHTVLVRGNQLEIDLPGTVVNGKLDLPASSKGLRDAITWSERPAPIHASGLKILPSFRHGRTIMVVGEGLQFHSVTLKVENKIPVSFRVFFLPFPTPSLDWAAEFSEALNADAAVQKRAAQLEYNGETLDCDEWRDWRMSCSARLSKGFLSIAYEKKQFRLH